MSSSSSDATTFDATLHNLSLKHSQAVRIHEDMRARADSSDKMLSSLDKVARYYRCAIYDILLQLYLIYWKQHNSSDITITNIHDQVDIVVVKERVVIKTPTTLMGVDYKFEEKLVVNTLFVDRTAAERYDVLREPFTVDFKIFLRRYHDVLPSHIYLALQCEENKFKLLNILRDGRR